MENYTIFYIKKYSRDEQTKKASFFYSFDNKITFKEDIDFFCPNETAKPTNPKIINTLLAHTAIALGISYYKLYPMAKIHIEYGGLDNQQTTFWKKFYTNGLGEFFFKNNISPKIIKFSGTKNPLPKNKFSITSKKTLLPIGGGKDSIVSAEILKKEQRPFSTITFGKDYILHKEVAKIIGVPRLMIKRTIDPKLFAMNQKGYYNGHVPISGIIAFVLIITSYLYDYKYIIMSNEKSAEEENTILDNIRINHQRSKSLEFEKDFGAYIKEYFSKNIKYFSILRGIYEIKIAKLFAQHKQYFSTFSSCNNNFKIIESNKHTHDRRCGKCPKCAFVYSMLRPNLTKKETQEIFGAELYEKKELEQIFKELWGISGIKPFECVGTNEEMILASKKEEEKVKNKSPYILELFKNKIKGKISESEYKILEKKLYTTYNEGNIPYGRKSILRKI